MTISIKGWEIDVIRLKRFLSVLLALTMCVSVIMISAGAADTTLGELFPDNHFKAVIMDAIPGIESKTGQDLINALAAFDGTLNASKKGITQANGLEYLTGAMEVNLSKNQITDWSFLEQTNQPNWEHHYEYKGSDGDYGNNVYWNLDGNPFSILPKEFGGNLVIKQMATTASIYEEDFRPRVFVRNTVDQNLSGTFNVTRCRIKDPDTGVLENAAAVSANLVAPNILTVGDFGTLSIRLSFSHVQKTGRQTIGVGIDQDVHYTTSDDYGTATPGSQSFKYYIHPQFFVYDRVTLSTVSDVVLTKVDKDTHATLQGAVYTLFDSADQKISENQTTGIDGKLTLSGLAPGDYYLVETSAPAGYESDPLPQRFTVPSVTLGGGVTSVQTTYDKDDDPTSHTPPVITPRTGPLPRGIMRSLLPVQISL